MNPTNGITAAEWLSEADEDSLTSVFWRFGEEPRARQIARVILDRRARKAILTWASKPKPCKRTRGGA